MNFDRHQCTDYGIGIKREQRTRYENGSDWDQRTGYRMGIDTDRRIDQWIVNGGIVLLISTKVYKHFS